ncbi:NAD-dependent dihydropyrimidine dehydrogenase subunit PreA [Legionella pneumophila]|uniref:NAD-dependent dihydropyrimidine dehydrogenase subunit PreA n=1 Tax=Legionella pneumophila TaxID=446 RepID=UPI000770AD72|nr:NAD-dependent dihydropyrimidine dehydrogenase subunit PreA [Legionella pneumophila]CZG36739.1 NAD-dependent dihydropyrimidine dehydrogenase subunit PreA [Legionella pneumophila]HAT1980918.1 NAD-dependent dihydropyrimidine dehydrogenase subunit PreA [Legionella pneumophila]HAT4422881.1 NAD-dependent dihydropyrimidine dehydrogenase subunit PreA [Legionella pneumophila]HAU1718954.1 NAD-dependent dihydropyrimidine dehydrogenase subunit PreA [Legionella pneumophila]
MTDITANCAGIISPNPFWLASAPPTNTGLQVQRAFEAGWGGAVWKTLGQPIQNVSSRFAAMTVRGVHGVGFNNIELITDRPLESNFRDIYETKKKYPNHPIIVSLMVETQEEWKEIIKRSIDAGADGLELNFGCPHGMCERGMGSAVGQNPKVNQEITSWARAFSSVPILVKLTPNVADIIPHAMAAKQGGAHGVSLINTIKSIIGVNIDKFILKPEVGNKSTNGGYCGAAVKPIALHMVAELAKEKEFGLPMSGIGGICNWQDAVEFFLLGASTVQVCTEVMLRGYKVVEDMIDGLKNYMQSHQFKCLNDFIGKAIPSYVDWGELNLNYETVAQIDPNACIGCQLCIAACHDGAHQCIHPHSDPSNRVPIVDEAECVGCNLCQIVCPVEDCISLVEVKNGYSQSSWNDYISQGKTLRPKKGAH